MSLVQWDPIRDMNNLQRQINQDMNREMNRLFDQLVALPRTSALRPGALSHGFVPAAESSEADEAFSLRLELPGLTAEDLDIQVTADSVSVRGERRSESTAEENGYSRTEFCYGTFDRQIALPGQVQNTAANADYTDGILTLTLPKAESEKNKVIKVEVAAS